MRCVAYLAAGPTVVPPLGEGELGITLHTGGGVCVRQPYWGKLSQVRDWHVDIGAGGRRWRVHGERGTASSSWTRTQTCKHKKCPV